MSKNKGEAILAAEKAIQSADCCLGTDICSTQYCEKYTNCILRKMSLAAIAVRQANEDSYRSNVNKVLAKYKELHNKNPEVFESMVSSYAGHTVINGRVVITVHGKLTKSSRQTFIDIIISNMEKNLELAKMDPTLFMETVAVYDMKHREDILKVIEGA